MLSPNFTEHHRLIYVQLEVYFNLKPVCIDHLDSEVQGRYFHQPAAFVQLGSTLAA